MTQIGEALTFALVSDPITDCPFQEPNPPSVQPEKEDIHGDDRTSVQETQENDGGVLGKNLVAGSPGKGGTWNALGAEPPRYQADQVDTKRSKGTSKIRVRGDASGEYPYTVAAHHLIPGNAALYESDLFQKYMEKGGKIEIPVKGTPTTFEITEHIGYNVNGSHNGVWLPGSYAIRATTSPVKGKSWGDLFAEDAHKDWCFGYMASVARKADGQFHDTHVLYSSNVLKMLNRLVIKLVKHQSACQQCQEKKKTAPPYVIKGRLYKLSRYLRLQVATRPRRWKRAFMTSDSVRTRVVENPIRFLEFLKAYDEATG